MSLRASMVVLGAARVVLKKGEDETDTVRLCYIVYNMCPLICLTGSMGVHLLGYHLDH